MTAHQLAQALLSGPDLPVVIPGGYFDSGPTPHEVDLVDPPSEERYWSATNLGPTNNLGYPLPRQCISLTYLDEDNVPGPPL